MRQEPKAIRSGLPGFSVAIMGGGNSDIGFGPDLRSVDLEGVGRDRSGLQSVHLHQRVVMAVHRESARLPRPARRHGPKPGQRPGSPPRYSPRSHPRTASSGRAPGVRSSCFSCTFSRGVRPWLCGKVLLGNSWMCHWRRAQAESLRRIRADAWSTTTMRTSTTMSVVSIWSRRRNCAATRTTRFLRECGTSQAWWVRSAAQPDRSGRSEELESAGLFAP